MEMTLQTPIGNIIQTSKNEYTPEDVQLIYTYGIIGIYMAINTIIMMYLYIYHRENGSSS